MAGINWKWPKAAGNCWKLTKITMMMPEIQTRWSYHSFDCVFKN